MPPPFIHIIMAVYRAKKENTQPQDNSENGLVPVSDGSMECLAKILNDSPSVLKLKGTEWEIHGLKPAVQWLIAEEACKIVRGEKMSMGDVIKEFANNLPSVARVITLALLNDRHRIEDKATYQKVYDELMWGDYELRDWAILLAEILKMIDVDFFFESTSVIQMVRKMTLERKMARTERK